MQTPILGRRGQRLYNPVIPRIEAQGLAGAGGLVGADRLAARVARTWWSQAVKNARERRTAILEALEELIPPEEYARQLVALTKSKDKRVRARGLELIAKLQGTVEDEGGPGQRVVVAFSSVLTGSRVEKHQGLSGRQDGKAPELREGDDPTSA